MSTTTFPLAAEEAHGRSGVAALLRRALGDPVWVRPAMAITSVATLVLYLSGLDRNGWANTYYAAAVQAGTQSWKAFFFGSLDAGNFITVDKPPASLWLMELSARIFGLSSWSMLAPEAIAGALTVLLLFFAVKRTFGPLAGLIAAVMMALTPVAVVMFRYNNPDALLTLLLVASAWAMVRALGGGRMRWLLLSAALVGLAFNTKDLQAYIIVPALVITYFLFAPGRLGRRFLQLVAAGAVLVISTGWWLVVVDAIPAAARPYVGGSTNNTVLDLVLGYNGLGRIFGQGGPARGGGAIAGGGAGFGGATGLWRLFSNEIGGQIAWLIPLAVVSLAIGLWAYRSRPRTEGARAGYVLWGLWFATHFAVFSFAAGIFHPYYTVALAPGVAALVGAGLVDMWILRGRSLMGAVTLGAAVAGTGWWGSQLLSRTPALAPGLGSLELALTIVAAVVIVAARLPFLRMVPKRVPQAALAVAIGGIMLGPAAYAAETVTRSSAGAIPAAGPAAATTDGMRTSFGGPPNGGPVTGGPPPNLSTGIADGGRGFNAPLGADAVAYLKQHQGDATWLVAVQSANEAASIELSTGKPVLAMGGFSGSDGAMTVDKLAQLVSSGKLRYVLLSGGGPGGGSSSDVQQWIVAHGTAVTIGSTTLYDLAPSGS